MSTRIGAIHLLERRSGRGITRLGLSAMALVIAGMIAGCSNDGGPEITQSTGPSSGPVGMDQLDPETDEVVGHLEILARMEVGSGFGRVVLGDDGWVMNSDDKTLSRIDLESNTVIGTFPFEAGEENGDLSLGSGDVWVTDPDGDRVHRFDGESGDPLESVASEYLPVGIVEAEGDMWVANHHGQPTGAVWRIEPDTGQVVARIPVGTSSIDGPQFMAAGAGSVWVGVPSLTAVVRIDPQSNAVIATIPVPDGGVCGQLVADDEAVWVAPGLCGDGSVARIDPSTNTVVASIESPLWDAAFGGALGFGSLWLSTDGGPIQVDPDTNAVLTRLVLEGSKEFGGGDITAGEGSLWIHDGADHAVYRLRPPD